ncbi:hypothetical protein [uncultured Microbacterium sp.]|uniref:Uncharacterized protein n=1 Tax=uncultured Microbacterium sp. TaxID=191216 RepID=A0A1Y5P1B8_9MICO|nr:hypothetical protein [uncultured Microbacterium sp.]SBS72486.1 conserved hypothetical protein [uncultured Microbacterium sp.]
MVTLLLDSTQLEVVLSAAERALAFHRGSVKVARTQIQKVQLTDDAWTWLRGVASPGTHLRGVVAMGTWRAAGASDFVVVRGHRPAVVIDIEGESEFQRLVLTTRHALALVQALQLETDSEPTDVVELATGAIPTTAPRPKPTRARRPAPATA